MDLAGSERVAKSGSVGVRLEEAKKINKSIAAVGNCVAALTAGDSRTHVPVRDSVLTRLLANAFGGNSKTVLCANIGPALGSYEETFGTLTFAKRAMAVRNTVTVNESSLIDETAAASAAAAAAAAAGGGGGAGGAGPADGTWIGGQQTSNEVALRALQRENEELRQEVRRTRSQLSHASVLREASKVRGSFQQCEPPSTFTRAAPTAAADDGRGAAFFSPN